MPADRGPIEARRDEIAAWLSYGMDIDVTLSSDEPTCFRAENPEFNLVGEGATEEEALDRLIERFTDFLDSFIVSGLPLPDRSDWRAKHPHPPDSDDG